MTGTITMFTTPEGFPFGVGTVDIDGDVEGVPSVPCPRCDDGKEAATLTCRRCDGQGRVLGNGTVGMTAPVFLNLLWNAGSVASLLNG
jgi:hypothetical protein